MILRQMFDAASCSYSYLVAAREGGEAVLIDPVREQVDGYLRLLAELDLRLVTALDTHLHADRFSGVGALAAATGCLAAMSERTAVQCVALRLADGERIAFDGFTLQALHTPGHTPDSMCFRVDGLLFTGDTLLIRGTGRTDLPGGDAAAAYESIFGRLLRLPDDTRIYPAHDYNGHTVSTIGEERRHSPRLQVKSRAEYVALMGRLNLPEPRLMRAALPVNLCLGAPTGAAPPAALPGAASGDGRAAGATLAALARAWARKAQAHWRSRRARAQTLAALRGLDTRALRDIGIDRTEIGSLAAELHGAAERTRRRALQDQPWS